MQLHRSAEEPNMSVNRVRYLLGTRTHRAGISRLSACFRGTSSKI
jgi:hypothetical protein